MQVVRKMGPRRKDKIVKETQKKAKGMGYRITQTNI